MVILTESSRDMKSLANRSTTIDVTYAIALVLTGFKSPKPSRAVGNITVSADYVIGTQHSIEEPNESLGWTMYKNMLKHKDSLAQIDAKTGETQTFDELLKRCVRTALHIRDRNLTRDDIITVCSKNHLNTVIPYIASQFLGITIAPLDPSLSSHEINHLIKQVRPKILFLSPDSIHIIEKIRVDVSLTCELVVFGETKIHTEFSEFLQPHQDEENFQPVEIKNLKETAVIHFSSGSTGLPKGICLNHYSLIGQILNYRQTQNPDYKYMKEQEHRLSFPLVQIGFTSLYWISAGTMLLSSIIYNCCRLVCEDFDACEIWNLITKHKPAVLILTPVQAMEMLENYRSDVDVSNILYVIIIGSSVSKQYSTKLEEAFSKSDIIRGYGLTEVSGILTNFVGNDLDHRRLLKQKEKIESVGLPVPGVSYRVVDLETNQNLGPNRRGELRVKSKFVMNGYYKLSSCSAFDEDGWLKTGDIVYFDEDFCFYVVDRIRESFKCRGWFISPSYLENELLAHPAVEKAVVVGVPKEDGYHPLGLVVVRKDFIVNEKEIELFLEKRVPERQRLIAGVRFIKSVPLTVTGKIKRQEITRKVLEELGYINH